MDSSTAKLVKKLNYNFVYTDYFLTHFPQTMARFSSIDFKSSMHWTQIQSKIWAINKLNKSYGDQINHITVLAGWYGLLPALMFESGLFPSATIRSFDIDPVCANVAESMNQRWLLEGWRFKATTSDANELSFTPLRFKTVKSNGEVVFLEEKTDLIINTSCEHFEKDSPWYSTIPKGSKVLLQTNNQFDCSDHVNCSSSLGEFEALYPMSKVAFKGELDLIKYKRFMIIGEK